MTHYARRIRQVKSFGIGPSDLVLDMGSGQDPHPRANILCDKFPIDSTERSMRAPLVVDRPLVVADAAHTPFADNTFDFIFCSHLLEHVERPDLVLSELQRIGRAGYIETPSRIYEKLWGWPFHRWFVDISDGMLVFDPKPRVIFDADLHNWFESGMQQPGFWRFFMTRVHGLNLTTRLVWRDRIPFAITDSSSDLPEFRHAVSTDLNEPHPSSSPRPTAAGVIKRRISNLVRRRSDVRVPDALAALKCVSCGAVVAPRHDAWKCDGCGARYPIEGDVHVFLEESGRSHDRFGSQSG